MLPPCTVQPLIVGTAVGAATRSPSVGLVAGVLLWFAQRERWTRTEPLDPVDTSMGAIDPAVFTAILESSTAVASSAIQVGASLSQQAAARREAAAEARRQSAAAKAQAKVLEAQARAAEAEARRLAAQRGLASTEKAPIVAAILAVLAGGALAFALMPPRSDQRKIVRAA